MELSRVSRIGVMFTSKYGKTEIVGGQWCTTLLGRYYYFDTKEDADGFDKYWNKEPVSNEPLYMGFKGTE